MAPTFILLYAVTNEKTVKLLQMDWMTAESKNDLPKTCSNNSDRYTLHSLLYLGYTQSNVVVTLYAYESDD